MIAAVSPEPGGLRFDLQVIASWIEPGARVLDLGCGNGDLLAHLKTHKQVAGTGIEQAEEKVARCIERGLTVLQGDFRTEVGDYPPNRFDVVVLSQTLQQIHDPKELLLDLLRIGRRVIVSFPNFAHWSARLQILFTGRAPVNDQLPYEWYDTPNIRVGTFADFGVLAARNGLRVLDQFGLDAAGQIVRTCPNLLASTAVYRVAK